MKQKPKTKLVHIGWVNRYDGGQFGSVWNTRREALLLHGYGYIDTVRVFAEVPVKRTKKGKK